MKISRLAIDNHQFTVVIVFLMVVFGLVSFYSMPRSEDPMIAPPGTTITIVYPGANPMDMEELIVNPIEEVVNELEDIKEIKSTAEDGLAVINVEFLSGSDPDEKYSQIVEKVNSIRKDLPQDLAALRILKWTITNVCILQAALISETAPYRQLVKEAENFKDLLEKIRGVKSVDILAYPKQQIRISLNLEKTATYRIPFRQVIQAIQTSNINIPGGTVKGGLREFTIKTSGYYKSVDDIKNTVVQSANGKILFLKDIADVKMGYDEQQYFARVNGQRAVFFTVTQKKGTNIYRLRDKIEKVLTRVEKQLSPGIRFAVVFDQTQSVRRRLNGFFINLLQGLLLVGLVIFLAVNIRAAFIVMLVIPISILAATGMIDLSGYGLQQMTISGFVIALGLLVDNAIVVTENISRFMNQGYSAKEAAIKGTGQIAWAIISSTLTTILAFFPMIMIGSMTGDFIRSLPLTVIFTLSASLLISLTLTPYVSSRFLKTSKKDSKRLIRRLLDRFIEKRYSSVLTKSVQHPVRVSIIALIVFALSLGLFPFVGLSFFPKAEKPQLMIDIDTPVGTSLEETDRIAGLVESKLKTYDEPAVFATNVGHGNPRIYYNMIPKSEKSNFAQIFTLLKSYRPQEFQNFVRKLRRDLNLIPGAKIKVKEFVQGPPIEAPIAIRVLGDNVQKLRKIAKDVEATVFSTKGTVNVHNPLGTVKINATVLINKEKAGLLGVPLAEINRTIRASIAGLPVSSFRDTDGKQYDIVVRLPVDKDFRFSDFDRIYVSSLTGNLIPLNQIVKVKLETTPHIISHYNLQRNVTITADVVGGVSVERVTKSILRRLKDYPLPKGYRFETGGEIESREESFGSMYRAMVVALIAIFGVLVLQFRSYLQPVIVFSAIPLAVVGSILALLITGYSFSFSAFVGLTSLAGIVVNNSIILVDYTNQLRREGMTVDGAIIRAAKTRFIPILLTVGTTIGGLLPLTLQGGTLWAPLGWTIIGGLLTSTLLTLVLVPALYKMLSGRLTLGEKAAG